MVQRFDVGARLSEMAVHNGVCYLAGQVPSDATQDISGQTRQVLAAIDALLCKPRLLLSAFAWQFAGYLLGASEVYVAMWMLGHPVSIGGAIAVEALTQAARHAAFFVPSGLGVQEAVVVLLARMFGVDEQTALSLALVKRMREVLFGCTALASWQAAELVRNRGAGVARPLR